MTVQPLRGVLERRGIDLQTRRLGIGQDPQRPERRVGVGLAVVPKREAAIELGAALNAVDPLLRLRLGIPGDVGQCGLVGAPQHIQRQEPLQPGRQLLRAGIRVVRQRRDRDLRTHRQRSGHRDLQAAAIVEHAGVLAQHVDAIAGHLRPARDGFHRLQRLHLQRFFHCVRRLGLVRRGRCCPPLHLGLTSRLGQHAKPHFLALLRCQRQRRRGCAVERQRAGQLQVHLRRHGERLAVAHRSRQLNLIAHRHGPRQRRLHHQRLGRLQLGIAAAKLARTVHGHGHDAPARQVVRQRERVAYFAIGRQFQRRLPERHIPQIGARQPAIAAAATRIALELASPPANQHIHQDRVFHAALDRRVQRRQRIGRRLTGQREHAFIHRPQRHFRSAGPPRRVAHRHFHGRLLPRQRFAVLGRHDHLQAVVDRIDFQLNRFHLHRGRAGVQAQRAIAAPTGNGQHADVHVGRMARLNRHVQRRRRGVQLDQPRAEDARALFRDQRQRARRLIAHEDVRGVPDLVRRLVGDEQVRVFIGSPDHVRTGGVEIARRRRRAAAAVAQGGLNAVEARLLHRQRAVHGQGGARRRARASGRRHQARLPARLAGHAAHANRLPVAADQPHRQRQAQLRLARRIGRYQVHGQRRLRRNQRRRNPHADKRRRRVQPERPGRRHLAAVGILHGGGDFHVQRAVHRHAGRHAEHRAAALVRRPAQLEVQHIGAARAVVLLPRVGAKLELRPAGRLVALRPAGRGHMRRRLVQRPTGEPTRLQFPAQRIPARHVFRLQRQVQLGARHVVDSQLHGLGKHRLLRRGPHLPTAHAAGVRQRQGRGKSPARAQPHLRLAGGVARRVQQLQRHVAPRRREAERLFADKPQQALDLHRFTLAVDRLVGEQPAALAVIGLAVLFLRPRRRLHQLHLRRVVALDRRHAPRHRLLALLPRHAARTADQALRVGR